MMLNSILTVIALFLIYKLYNSYHGKETLTNAEQDQIWFNKTFNRVLPVMNTLFNDIKKYNNESEQKINTESPHYFNLPKGYDLSEQSYYFIRN